jgi:hypothetical protein
MKKEYIVRLSAEERQQLEGLISKGKAAAFQIRHAHILLKADVAGPRWTDQAIAAAFSCHRRTVEELRKRFVLEGFAVALGRKKRAHPPRPRRLDGEQEARLIALSCSAPPQGRRRWTLTLLADTMVALQVVDQLSYQTVRRTLKKTSCSRTGGSVG